MIAVVEGHPWELPEEPEPWVAWVEGARWGVVGGGASLLVPFAAGRVPVELRRGGEVRAVELQVAPDPHKLDAGSWQALVDELERAEPGSVAGMAWARAWGLQEGGADAPAVVVALLSLLDGWLRALHQVLARPRERQEAVLRERALHQIRTADPALLAWISAHPREAAWLDRRADPGRSGPPPRLPVVETRATLDHPVHRHLVWLVLRVARRLDDAGQALMVGDGPRRGRALALREAAGRLRRFLRQSPLRTVQPAPASDEALLVVLGDPRYARAHRLGRTLLTLGLDAEASGEVPTVRTFDLYERWCWHRLLGLARRHFRSVPTPTPAARHGQVCTWTEEGSTWTVLYNPEFGAERQGAGPRSRTSGRRPDLVVRRDGPSGSRFVVLDAKYRAGTQMLIDALDTAHIYRDALVWDEAGGRPAGALLLIPRAPSQPPRWFHPGWVEAEGLGFYALSPACEADPWPVLRAWLGALVGEPGRSTLVNGAPFE